MTCEVASYPCSSKATDIRTVQELARHADSRTTMKVYARSRMDTKVAAVELLRGTITEDLVQDRVQSGALEVSVAGARAPSARKFEPKKMVGGTGLEPVTPPVSWEFRQVQRSNLSLPTSHFVSRRLSQLSDY